MNDWFKNGSYSLMVTWCSLSQFDCDDLAWCVVCIFSKRAYEDASNASYSFSRATVYNANTQICSIQGSHRTKYPQHTVFCAVWFCRPVSITVICNGCFRVSHRSCEVLGAKLAPTLAVVPSNCAVMGWLEVDSFRPVLVIVSRVLAYGYVTCCELFGRIFGS